MKLSFSSYSKMICFILGLVMLVGIYVLNRQVDIITFPVHMTAVSMMYFVVPPLLLYTVSSILPKKKTFLSPIALILFSIILTLQHLPAPFQMEIVLVPWMKWLLFLLAVEAWRPFFIKSPPATKRYARWNLVAITPACLLLLLDAWLTPTMNLVSLSASFCIPADVPFASLDGVYIHPRVDQAATALVMMAVHKGSLYVTNKQKRLIRHDEKDQ